MGRRKDSGRYKNLIRKRLLISTALLTMLELTNNYFEYTASSDNLQ